jgi:hypothetical protein
MSSSARGYCKHAQYCSNLFRIRRLQDLNCTSLRKVLDRLEIIFLQPFTPTLR